MRDNDSTQSLLKKKFTAIKSSWSVDSADLFVLLCSCLLITASIVLVALIFLTQANFYWDPVPTEALRFLQRGISALSITITSAVILVAGKRYVLFKFARGGIRSQRVAAYSHPSIGNIAFYLVWHRFELPLLALSGVWGLGLATGLTVSDAWTMVPVVQSTEVSLPFGPLDSQMSSLSIPASGQLSYVMASQCSGVAGTVGLVEIVGDTQLASGGPMGVLFYPPLPGYVPNSAFSLPASLNGFNVSMEPVSSVPPTAQNLTCVNSSGWGSSTGQIWYEGGDNQTLSIIVSNSQSLYRFNASAIVMAGTLQSTGNGTKFTLNGTTWPNVMSSDRWAQDITSIVCNATYPLAGTCGGGGVSLIDFSVVLNSKYYSLSVFGNYSQVATGIYWSSALGMAMGAYTFASFPSVGTYVPNVSVTYNDFLVFTPRYGVYVLIANIVVSVIMLIVVVRLRLLSGLGTDFVDATRLLLDPLKNPELFNSSLDTTIKALGNPYMLVKEDSKFLLVDQPEASSERMRRIAGLYSHPPGSCDSQELDGSHSKTGRFFYNKFV